MEIPVGIVALVLANISSMELYTDNVFVSKVIQERFVKVRE